MFILAHTAQLRRPACWLPLILRSALHRHTGERSLWSSTNECLHIPSCQESVSKCLPLSLENLRGYSRITSLVVSVYTMLPKGHTLLFRQWTILAEDFLYREKSWRALQTVDLVSTHEELTMLGRKCHQDSTILWGDTSTSIILKGLGLPSWFKIFSSIRGHFHTKMAKSWNFETFHSIGEMRKKRRINWHEPMLQWLVWLDQGPL